MSPQRRQRHPVRHFLEFLVLLAIVLVVLFFLAGGSPGRGASGTVQEIGKVVRRNFTDGVKDLPDPEKGYYFETSDQEGQKIYSALYGGIADNEKQIEVPSGDLKKIEATFNAVMADHPEFFWLSGATRTTAYKPVVGKSYSVLVPEWTCDENEQKKRKEQVEDVVRDYLAGQDDTDSDYDRIKRAYEFIIDRTDYDDNAPDNQNLYSALVGRRSVCAGYSKAFQYLLKRQSIPCIYVTGTNDINGEPHGWNIVECGGHHYQVDVTWGDPVYSEGSEPLPEGMRVIGYDYLCCSDSEIKKTHTYDQGLEVPACESVDLEYYRMNGMLYDSYDPDKCLQVMLGDVSAGKKLSVFKFTDDSLYDQAVGDLTGRLLEQAANHLLNQYGLTTVSNYYQEDKDLDKVTIYWQYQ